MEPDGFTGDLADLDMDELEEEYALLSVPYARSLTLTYRDDYLIGPTQELDLSASEDEAEPALALTGRVKKSKQAERPAKIIPTGSDASSDDEDEDDEGTGRDIVARSRALDARLAAEAELDNAELQAAEAAGLGEDDFADADADMNAAEEGAEEFVLPTAEEREEEKKRGGPDLATVQKRMRTCVRVLRNFARLGNGR
jgi:ribosomal RNA methyltransferase Nop2